MSRTTSTLALLAAAMLAVSVVGATPALASDGSLSVSASTNDDGSATVTVAHNDTADNDTAAENATVTVEAVDNTSYAGTGTYSTDENGTVSLPAHDGNETAELEVTAEYDGASASTTLTLEPANGTNDADPFGQEVAAFIAQLETTDGGIGSQVADFVLANNPGDPPDHAGPPDDAGQPDHAGPPDDDANETDAGNETDDGQGPPDHAGPPDDDSDDEKGGGPPDHAGPPDDSDEEDSDEDEDA